MVTLASFKTIKVGKPLNVDDLKKHATPHARRTSPRDEDLLKLVNEVSVGPASQVLPWHFEGKAATARAAATKVVRASGAKVHVSSRRDMPGVLRIEISDQKIIRLRISHRERF